MYRMPRGLALVTQGALLALGIQVLPAAPAASYRVEVLEMTYRLTGGNTGEVIIHQRFKAMDAQGRAEISKLQFPYIPGFQDIEFKSIRTMKKDGSAVQGDPNGAFDGAAPTGDPLTPYFSDLRMRTLLAPNVDTGDTVECEAVQHIHKWDMPGQFWFSHYLTSIVPVVSEIVVLDLPTDRPVSFSESSTIHGNTEIANGRKIERWELRNLEAAKPSVDAAEPLFAVSSIPSWDALGAWIHSLNDPAAEPSPEITALAARLTANKKDETERISALYSYVATRIRYVGVWFGAGRYQPHPAATVLRNGYGDCKDQTVLLSALLRSAGFKAHPVLTTPGVGVRLPDLPAPDQFIHEFVAVETKSGLMFLDASMGPVPPQVLAFGVRGRKALLIGDTTASPIDIPIDPPVQARVSVDLRGKVAADGAFDGIARFELVGIAELALRRAFLDSSEEEKEKTLSDFTGAEFRGASVLHVENGDPADLTKPFWLQFELHKKDFFAPDKTSMQVTLGWNTGSLRGLDELPKPEKTVPVESAVISTNLDLIVDTAFMITDHLPAHRDSPSGKYDSEYEYENGHLLLKRSLSFKAGMLAPAEWAPLIDLIKAARDESGRGFTLERRRTSTTAVLSPLSRAMQKGSAAYQRRDYEGARKAYLEATQIDPKNQSAWNDLGRAYAALHAYPQAEAAYKKQIEINPSDPYAYNNLGLVYRALRREGDAIESFRKQIAVSPRDRFAHENLAISYANQNDWEKARVEAATAAEITPEDPVKWVRLGRAQLRTGHVDEARTSFERGIGLPHDAMEDNNVAFYLSEVGVDLDKAWKLVSEALNSEARLVCEPDALAKTDACAAQLRRISFMLDTAGWILYREGKAADAEPYLRSAYAITPRADMSLHLSVLLAKTGRVDDSVKFLAEALSRPNLDRLASAEARRELAKAVGGDAELDARCKQFTAPQSGEVQRAKVTVLVDSHGKILEAAPAGSAGSADIVADTKLLTLTPISWPDHAIRSLRTVEYRREGSKWVVDQSYAGLTADSTVAR
jgi:tetratricopeptide (TPR) repeat protein